MYTIHNTLKISDLRKHTDAVLDEVDTREEPVIIISRSVPRAVLISYRHYQNLKEKKNTQSGLDFLIHPSKELMIHKKGGDIVNEIRRLRGYEE